MPDTYDHITLMCRLKAAQRRNKELESGERYIQLEELYQKEYNVYEHKIEKLKKELADAHKETIRALNAEKQRDNALDKAAVFRHQFYEAASRLEEEQGKNRQKTRRAARPQRALLEKTGAYTASYSSSST